MRPSARFLDDVRAIVLGRLAGHAADVYLFGSWARGDARQISDIDVAIRARRPLPIALLSEIREALSESHIPYPVDIVDLNDVSPSFRARILSEGVRWTA
ncbi:MAG: nucleotidyltransferase domain-containing protein [Candidatus Thermoplasmatota archaeon]